MIKPESRFIELKYMILGKLVSDDAKLIKKILEIKSNGEIIFNAPKSDACLGDCNWTRNGWVLIYELYGCGFESGCNSLKFQISHLHRAGVP